MRAEIQAKARVLCIAVLLTEKLDVRAGAPSAREQPGGSDVDATPLRSEAVRRRLDARLRVTEAEDRSAQRGHGRSGAGALAAFAATRERPQSPSPRLAERGGVRVQRTGVAAPRGGRCTERACEAKRSVRTRRFGMARCECAPRQEAADEDGNERKLHCRSHGPPLDCVRPTRLSHRAARNEVSGT